MKLEHWLIIVALLIVAALGGASWQQTRLMEQRAAVEAKDRQIAALEGQVRTLEERLLPPPYHEPLEGARISSGCGYRMDPMGGGTEGLHKGVDLVGPIGAPVMAVLAGTVAEHWPSPGGHYRGHPVYGGFVVIDHGNGLFTLYGHLQKTNVHEGWHVEMGEVIGWLGDTGVTTGPHLHFEVVTDPLRYLAGSGE